MIIAIVIVVSAAVLFYLISFQPNSMKCGPNLHILHMWLYILGFLVLGVILIYVELLILYFLRLSKDKKLGFLLEKKQSIRCLCYKVMASFGVLTLILAFEVSNYGNLYVCINRIQEEELTIEALVLKWAKNVVIVLTYFFIFATFMCERTQLSNIDFDNSLIRMESKIEREKSFSIINSDHIDMIF